MTSLSVKNLTITFRNSVRHGFNIQTQLKTTISSFSFEINSNQTTFLIGKTGIGKTTILKAIIGLIPNTSGDILVNHQPIHHLSARERSVWFSYVPQSNVEAFTPVISVLDSLLNSVRAGKKKINFDVKNKISKLEQLFGLDSDLSIKKPYELSGGQMQRFGLIRGLLNQPNILLLDEPTAALDSKTKFQVMSSLIDFCKNEDITLLIANHDSEILNTFADHIIDLEISQNQAPFSQ